MFIDSGSPYNLLTETAYAKLRGNSPNLLDSQYPVLVTYSGKKQLEIVGGIRARVSVPGYPKKIVTNFYAVRGASISLMGYSSARALNTILVGKDALEVSYNEYHKNLVMALDDLSIEDDILKAGDTINPFPSVPNVKLKLNIDRSVLPKFRNFCIGQNRFREEMRADLRENLLAGIIRRVKFPGSSWVSPSMLVPKKDGKMRFCVDMTAPNKAIIRNNSIQMPTLKQMEEATSGNSWFAKLDLKKAFHHIELDEDSKYITTFRTPFGYFQYNRMPFGLNVAPEFFQGILEGLLVGDNDTPGVSVYIDDILIVAKSEEELMGRLEAVKEKLKAHNMTINEEKTEIKQNEIEFLGFLLSTNKVTVTEDRVRAIKSMKPPHSYATLKSFLGKINFLNSFIPRLAEVSQPLWTAARSNSDFVWGEIQQNAFESVKKTIVESRERCHFRNSCPTYLITDASDIATAAILFQVIKDETGKDQIQVVEYASKLLNPIQKRYPQFQRELLGIVTAIKHFQKYLRTTKFTVFTDLETADSIISQSLCAHKSILNRHERWILELSEFDFQIKHIPGKLNVADALSRLASESTMDDESFDVINLPGLFAEQSIKKIVGKVPDNHCCHLTSVQSLPDDGFMSCDEVKEVTSHDKELQEVMKKLHDKSPLPANWRNKLFDFWIDGIGLLRYEARIVLPAALREKAIAIAHQTHFGADSTHSILMEYVYWPGMENDVRNAIKECEICALLSRKPDVPPMKSVTLPEFEWQHVAIDFYEAPSLKAKCLSIQDYMSKKLLIYEVASTSAASITQLLDNIFMDKGYVTLIRSDWGSPFQSREYLDWAHSRGIIVEHSAPYHPEGNGLIERSMRGLNRVLRACVLMGLTKPSQWRLKMRKYVQLYNARPHRMTGYSPDALLEGRRKGIGLPLGPENTLNPVDKKKLQEINRIRQEKAKIYRDQVTKARRIDTRPGDLVWIMKEKKSDKLDCAYYSDQKFLVLSRDGNVVDLKGVVDGKVTTRNLAKCLRCPINSREKRREEVWEAIRNYHGEPTELRDINWSGTEELASDEEIESSDDLLGQKFNSDEQDDFSREGNVEIKDFCDSVLNADKVSHDVEVENISGVPLFLIPKNKETAKAMGAMDDVNKLVGRQISEDISGRTKRRAAMKSDAATKKLIRQKVLFIQNISPEIMVC